jgi:hypothetical protein
MQVQQDSIQTARQLGYFTESVLGPNTLVTYREIADTARLRWLPHVCNHGVVGHTDTTKAFSDWREPAAAKGITSMPPPRTLEIWKHYYYNGNLYVIDTPVVLVVSKKKAPVLLDYGWCGVEHGECE